jgi:hypothetical protein
MISRQGWQARLLSGTALLVTAVVGSAHSGDARHAVIPLEHAHAHNDFEHGRPLFDALEHGFCSVEADVFLVEGQLLVGHSKRDLKPDRTLERLYLDPLRARAQANGGRIYPGVSTVYLLVDVKSDAAPTYAALHARLAGYADLISTIRDGHYEQKAITVVISGNRDKAGLASQKVRYAGLDGRIGDLDSDVPTHLMPWISDRWGMLFRWRGDGPMPAEERAKLAGYVRKAHAHGRQLRFWATPERPEVWTELRAAGVDLISTDQLGALQQYLLRENRPR